MNKVFSLIAVFFLFACNSNEQKSQTTPEEAQPVVKIASYSEAFESSFEGVLNNYYTLRDALVAADSAAANKAATRLIQSTKELEWDELKTVDTNNIIIPTAQTYTGGITSESEGLLGETNLEAKRKAFQMISGNIFDLARAVRYSKQKIYLLHCPMVFNNTGADWLSNSTEIKNPYFGDKMLTCGAVKDSVVLR